MPQEVLIPPWVQPATEHVALLDDASFAFQPEFARGAVQVQSFADPRWQIRRRYQAMRGDERAALRSALAEAAGKRAIVRATVHQPARGAFPDDEKLVNNDFASGASGWNVVGGTITATDRRLRLTFNGTGTAQVNRSCALTPNVPHVARYFLADGQGAALALGAFQSYIQSTTLQKNVTSVEGLNTLTLVPEASPGTQLILYPTAGSVLIPTGQIAGNYVEVGWASLSQCMLVDGGGNLLQFSDTLASPWTTSAASRAANADTAADGTVTATTITDTAPNVAHFVSQAAIAVPSAAADFMVCGEFKVGARSFVWLQLIEATGGTSAVQYFNLSTGALGSQSNGANWANLRAFIAPLGNGWYYCALVARKTSAAVSLSLNMGPSNVDNVQAYAGSANITTRSRRVTLSQSSVPARQVLSGASAVAATSWTGSTFPVKGLPVSTAGLLLTDDFFEVNGELKQCTAQLDSDAAGLGYLKFRPALAVPPADNDPVIVNSPMGRFRLMKQFEYDSQFGLYLDADVELTETY